MVEKDVHVAFDLSEYCRCLSENAIRNDLMSYLAEYRFQVFDYSYQLRYCNGHLHDTDKNEPMLQMAEKAIEKSIKNNWSTNREKAEYEGIVSLDNKLQTSQTDDRIIWASPPGPKEENYGDYGFIYEGFITKVGEGDEREIQMTAYRVETREIEEYNRILSQATGFQIGFETAEEFLAHPLVVHTPIQSMRQVLLERHYGDLENNRKFNLAVQLLNPLIKEFIQAVKLGLPENELRQIFYAIENLALHIKEGTLEVDYYTLTDNILNNKRSVIAQYGAYRAPFAAGSCGGSGNKETNILSKNNLIKSLLGEDEDEYGSLEFECPHCHNMVRRPKNTLIKNCPKCGKDVSCK